MAGGSPTRADPRADGPADPPRTSLRLDWVLTLLSLWLIGGLYIDLWAHAHGRVDDTFFTPWHALLYAAAASFAILLGTIAVVGRRRPSAAARMLPGPYLVTFIGALLFAAGGLLDLAWHTLFGFEVHVEALLSPTHLLLAASGLLMVGGPIRSASARLWADPQGVRTWRLAGPFVLPLAMAFAVLIAFSQYANPVVDAWSSVPETTASEPTAWIYVGQGFGAAGILIAAALLAGIVAFARRIGRLPFGAYTALVAVPAAMATVLEDEYRFIPGVIVAGLVADVVTRAWPARRSRIGDALVAFLVPAVYFAFYFLTVALTSGIGWSIHLWLGSIVIAGVIGLFIDELAHGRGTPVAAPP